MKSEHIDIGECVIPRPGMYWRPVCVVYLKGEDPVMGPYFEAKYPDGVSYRQYDRDVPGRFILYRK